MLRLVLLTLFFASSTAVGSELVSCRKQWKQEEYHYDFQEEYEAFQERLKRTQCEKDWTILVYMAADNDLFPYALLDIYEMEAAFKSSDSAGSTLKTDLLVQIDGPASDDLRRLHIFSGPVSYEKKGPEDFSNGSLNNVRSPIAARLNEKNESEQKRLENFLNWGARNYPAKNYMVIVWGHGQGWKAYPVENPAESRYLEKKDLPTNFPSTKKDKSFGGIAFRKSSGTWLDIPALRNALDSFTQEIGKPVDVYASDSCLMQMLEVAYELSNQTRFVVGSTQVQSFLGLPYRRLLYELNRGSFNGQRKEKKNSVDTKDEPYLLAKMIPELMYQSLDAQRGSQSRAGKEAQAFVTSSALSSSEAKNLLVPALRGLSLALKNYLAEDPLRAMDIKFVLQKVPTFEGGAQDLGVFLGYLDVLLRQEREKTGSLSAAAEDLVFFSAKTQDALNRAVLSYAYGSAYGVDPNSHILGFVPKAISLWLPVEKKEYTARRQEFLQSQFYLDSQWQVWLDDIF